MKLITFASEAGPHVGALLGSEIADLTAAGVATTMRGLIEGGPAALARVRDKLGEAPRRSAAGVSLMAPIPDPSKILCSGINYRSHAAENPNARMPDEPFFFAKLPTSVVRSRGRYRASEPHTSTRL